MSPDEGRKPCVCVIDDNASLRKALDRLLRAAGYDVEVLESAEAFLRQEHSQVLPDCVLLDVRMPSMSGLELQRRLAGDNAPPIVFITAHDDARARQEALDGGAVDFLLKPFDQTLLLDAVDRAIRARRSD